MTINVLLWRYKVCTNIKQALRVVTFLNRTSSTLTMFKIINHRTTEQSIQPVFIKKPCFCRQIGEGSVCGLDIIAPLNWNLASLFLFKIFLFFRCTSSSCQALWHSTAMAEIKARRQRGALPSTAQRRGPGPGRGRGPACSARPLAALRERVGPGAGGRSDGALCEARQVRFRPPSSRRIARGLACREPRAAGLKAGMA